MNNRDIKVVIFDWGGVCCKPGEPFASLALQSALNLIPSEIEAGVKDIQAGYYRGEYTRDSFWGAVMKYYGIKEGPSLNPVALSEAYLNSYEIYPDVLDYILALRKKYKVGLLSNLTPEMRERIHARHNLRAHFDWEVFSCDPDVKSAKPDSKPFRVALEKAGASAGESLFIDDGPRNIEAAANLGMATLLFKDRGQFFKDIIKLV